MTNTGKRAGDEVVQLYTHQRDLTRQAAAAGSCEAFQRVTLKPGQTKTVKLRLTAQDLAHWDVTRPDGWWRAALRRAGRRVSADIRSAYVPEVRGETIPARDLSRPTRAENFDDYEGVRLVDESKVRGTAVGASADGAWLEFADARLGSGTAKFTARVAGAAGKVELRLGSPAGPLIGTAKASGTGSVYTYETVNASLSAAAKGRQDVYLVLSEGLRLSAFSLR